MVRDQLGIRASTDRDLGAPAHGRVDVSVLGVPAHIPPTGVEWRELDIYNRDSRGRGSESVVCGVLGWLGTVRAVFSVKSGEGS